MGRNERWVKGPRFTQSYAGKGDDENGEKSVVGV